MAIRGLALVFILISHWVGQHKEFSLRAVVLPGTTTWRQPGLSRGFDLKFQKLSTEEKKHTHTENKHTTVFINI